MELTKRKEELMAYLEENANNTTAGMALRNFLRETGSTSRFDTPYMESKNSTEEEGSSGESEEPDEIMEEVKEHEDVRDDEDFIVLVPPKGKKKTDKKIMKPVTTKQTNSKKRKCEFCGTVETPMWRRGPTGKGTLCNACGVKWSLKFRKRAGKKANKSERGKEEPREQRQSTRKKIPSTKKSYLSFTGLEVPELIKQEDEGDHTGLCCNHSLRRKREEESDDIERAGKKIACLSDCESDSTNPGLGRLLNVVEVQLVEEEQLDRVKVELQQLRAQLQATQHRHTQQILWSKAQVLSELADLRREFHTMLRPNDHTPQQQQTAHLMQNLTATIANHIQDLSSSNNTTIVKMLEDVKLQVSQLNNQFDTTFVENRTRAVNDFLHMEKLINLKEEQIRNGLACVNNELGNDFEAMYRRLNTVDDSLKRAS